MPITTLTPAAQQDLVAVKVDAGLVVWHTRQEWERFTRGVDLAASRAVCAPLELDHEPTTATAGEQ